MSKPSTIALTSKSFSGTVSLSASATNLAWSFNPANVTLTPNGTASSVITISAYSNTPAGSYTVTVSGKGGTETLVVTISVTVLSFSGGGSGGASLAYGTLITMANGTQAPVQNLAVGSQMLGYDPITGRSVVSTVTSIVIKNATNMLVINTGIGSPLRVDASVTEVLWTRLSNGTVLWLPAPEEQVGCDLWTQNGWVAITSINYAPAGNHTMWDITATAPYFASGYLDPPRPS